MFLNKFLEDPLKTAAIGAALYYGAPSMMGAMGGDAAQTMVDEYGSTVANPEHSGLLANLPSGKEVASYAKPVSESLRAASAAKGLLSTPQQQLQSQVPQGGGNSSQLLAQLYQPYQMQPRQKTNWG